MSSLVRSIMQCFLCSSKPPGSDPSTSPTTAKQQPPVTSTLNACLTDRLAETDKTKKLAAIRDPVDEIVEEVLSAFTVSTEKMRHIIDRFVSEMQKGLMNDGETVAMIPTFVSGRPTGQETGRYLALDLGGTFLRVCEVNLKGNRDFSLHQQKYKVPEAIKSGEMRDLCDFIADCLDTFITKEMDHQVPMLAPERTTFQLGFTFSFPVSQTSINRGVLKQWTKGFSCKNAVDRDVVVMLQDSLLRKNVPVNIAAIVNDTVGTLMALGYRQPETAIGVILGTGTNACYYEDLDHIPKWKGGKTAFDHMVINTEWGAFDNERIVLPLTTYDCKVDRESINPRQQTFEKMISGMYLGEIARNCIIHYIDRQLLFAGRSSSALNGQYSFETSYMSTIQADDTTDLAETRHILEDVLSVPGTTLSDRRAVKRIIELVGRRAARLSACGLAAVLKLCNLLETGCTIAIDGSLYEHYPGFEMTMMEALTELYGPAIESKVILSLARDGSGLGAAIVAMIAHKAAQQEARERNGIA